MALFESLSRCSGGFPTAAPLDETSAGGESPTAAITEPFLSGAKDRPYSGEASAEQEEACQRLEGLIAEERQLVIEERELYERRQAASGGPADDTLLAPLSYWWAEVERQEAGLDRQIERKIRLLVELERRRRRPERSRKERGSRRRAAGARLAAERASAAGRKKGAKRGKI